MTNLRPKSYRNAHKIGDGKVHRSNKQQWSKKLKNRKSKDQKCQYCLGEKILKSAAIKVSRPLLLSTTLTSSTGQSGMIDISSSSSLLLLFWTLTKSIVILPSNFVLRINMQCREKQKFDVKILKAPNYIVQGTDLGHINQHYLYECYFLKL